jgi:hypothetical protein
MLLFFLRAPLSINDVGSEFGMSANSASRILSAISGHVYAISQSILTLTPQEAHHFALFLDLLTAPWWKLIDHKRLPISRM